MNDTSNLGYCSTTGGGDYGFYEDTKLIKVEENADEIYIYDYYIKSSMAFDDEGLYIGDNLYADSEEKLLLKRLKESDYPIESDITKLGITLPIYKHTFKQRNDGTYYWLSAELTNSSELKIIE